MTNFKEIGNVSEPKQFARIDVRGLPNYNFVSLFMNYMGETRSRPEINYQNARCALTAIALKRVYAYTENIYGEVFSKPLYINNFSHIIADTATGKNVSHDDMRDIVIPEMGSEILADVTSPETLKKTISDKIILTKVKVHKDKETEEEKQEFEVAEIPFPPSRYPRGWKVLWSAEFGAIWASLQKTYMANMKQELCNLYSNATDPKGNSGEKSSTIRYEMNDIFFAISGSTTEAGLKYLSTDDIVNGIWNRFEKVHVQYKDFVMPDEKNVDKYHGSILERASHRLENPAIAIAKNKQKALQHSAQIINMLLEQQSVQVLFDEDAVTLIRNYEMGMRKHFLNNPHISMIRSRHMENIYKHAIALELGNIPYYVVSHKARLYESGLYVNIDNTWEDCADINALFNKLSEFNVVDLLKYRLDKLVVSAETVKFVLKMYDRIYLPSDISTCELIMGCNIEATRKDMAKVMDILEHAPVCTKANLLKICNESHDKTENHIKKEYDNLQKMRSAEVVSNSDIVQTEGRLHVLTDYCAWLKHAMADINAYPEDMNMTMMSGRDLQRKCNVTNKEIEPIMDTLSSVQCVLTLTLNKNAKTHIYFPFSDKTELPDSNYVNYTGDGKYPSGLSLRKIKSETAPFVPKEQEKQSTDIVCAAVEDDEAMAYAENLEWS